MVHVQDHMVRVLEGCHREEDAGEAAPRRELGGVGAPEKQHLLRVVGLRNRMSSHISARLVPRISDRCGHALRGRRGASASSRTRGGVNHGTALKKSKKESFRNFFATQIATKSAQIASKFLRNWTLPKLRKKLHATLAQAKTGREAPLAGKGEVLGTSYTNRSARVPRCGVG